MPLERQIISLPFVEGVDTKSDPKQVRPTKLLVLENGYFKSPGRILKRFGYNALIQNVNGGSNITSGTLVATLKDELMMGDGLSGYSYSSTGWVNKGFAESLSISTKPLVRNTYQQTTPDLTVHPSGISVAAWEDSSTGFGMYSVFDTVTGQPILANQTLGTQSLEPKVFSLGNYVIIVFYETSNNHIQYVAIQAATPQTAAAPVDLTTTPGTQKTYDARVIGSRLFLAYRASAAPRATLLYLTANLIVSAEVKQAETFANAVTVFGDASNNVWVVYYNGSGVKFYIYDYGLANVVLAPTLIDVIANVRNIAGIGKPDPGATIIYEVSAAATYNYYLKAAALDLNGGSTTFITHRSVGLASEPWYVNGEVHVLAAYQSALQSTYFVMAIRQTGTQGGGRFIFYVPGQSGLLQFFWP